MKKYTEKFIQDYSILNTAVLGFELEFYTNKDISYYKVLELLNQDLAPLKVYGFRQYHPDFKPTAKEALISPDYSGGSNLVELITGPQTYGEAKYYLIKALKFIQNYGYTNEKCSVHFNLSFPGEKNLNDLNILKLILNVDEDEIYRYFPSRKNNIYAKSVKKIIPFKQYDFFNIPINYVKNILKIPTDKYFGINFININNDKETQRIEYRYIGGTDYEKNVGSIIYFLDRFIIDVYNSIGTDFNSNDAEILEHYLEDNINKFKMFSKYDNFIVEFPKIQIQIDQNSLYEFVNAYFDRIYEKIWNLIEATDELTDCILNYVTTTQTLEVVDGKVKSNLNIDNIEFINCNILDGVYEDCMFHGCEVMDSQISKSKVVNSEVTNSKLLACHVETSGLKNCYFMSGFLNGDMFGGVFRSGKLGPYATLSSDTKVVSDVETFFHEKPEEEMGKSYKKGGIKDLKNIINKPIS